MQCIICEYTKSREDCGIADFWHLAGYRGLFWGAVCRKCMHVISPPNGRAIDQEKYNEAVAIYQIKRSNNV